MKKTVTILFFAVFLSLCLSSCGNSAEAGAGKESSQDMDAYYSEIIDQVLEYNHKYNTTAKNEDNPEDDIYWFERESSNFMIWEDENNYYVMLVKNCFNQIQQVDMVWTDGYKVGKSNKRVSSDGGDRAKVNAFYFDNAPMVYDEKNIDLVWEEFTKGAMRSYNFDN